MSNHTKAKKILDDLENTERNGLLLFLSEIALQRPSAVINASESLKKRKADLKLTLDKRLIELIKQNKFIEAIKLYREETGFNLRESKIYCDNLRATIRFS